jgi:Kef-type K+ transport system membrane component KefB
MSLASFFAILFAGLLGPLLAGNRYFTLPVVVGRIIGGILIGNTGSQLLSMIIGKEYHLVDLNSETLTFISNLGFAMLLFVVGTKLPIARLYNGINGTAKRGLFAALITLLITAPTLGFALSWHTGVGHPLMFALLCAASSTSTVLPILNERKLAGDEISALIVWITITDVATMVLLPLAFGIGNSVMIIMGCVSVCGTGAAVFIILRRWRETESGKRYRKLSKDREWGFDMSQMFVVLVGLAALAQWFGASILVAGFVAGLTSNLLKQPKRFNKQLTGNAEAIFVPVFFVYVGARINVIDVFTSIANIELALLVVAASLIAHVSAAKLSRLSWSAGLTASQHMGLPTAIVGMGLAEHVLNPGQAAAIILAALLSLAVCMVGIVRLPHDPPPVA